MARATARRGIPARAGRLAGAHDAAGASRGDRPEWKRGGGLITIIAGEFKNRRLKTPAGDTVRPTGARVREAWFSILQHWIPEARVLDLFAGSGALGLEALSRGAQTADFVEVHRNALAALRANLKSLKLEAMFRIVPFARVFSIEHSADTPIPGDDTRRYGDTAVTFLYAP